MEYILIALLIFTCVFLAKNNNTFENLTIIINAIGAYRLDCIDHYINPEVDYRDMKDYDTVFWCLWDWGYTNILPADKFEVIAPYIKK